MNAGLDWSRLRPSLEIELLGNLASAEEVRGELGRVASTYGKINTILPLPKKSDESADHCGFLVCFEKTMDALAASRHWHCLLFGFTTVVVFVKFGGGAREVGSVSGGMVEKKHEHRSPRLHYPD